MADVLLFAEPDPDLGRFYEAFFTEHGFHVETAGTALECYGRLKRSLPAALIIDLDLKEGGPEHLLADLRENFPSHLLPPIFLTGCDPEQSVRGLLVAPVVRYFQKPFPARVLLEYFAACKTVRRLAAPAMTNGDASQSLMPLPDPQP